MSGGIYKQFDFISGEAITIHVPGKKVGKKIEFNVVEPTQENYVPKTDGSEAAPCRPSGGTTMDQVKPEKTNRFKTYVKEIDDFLGGGIAKGCTYLLFGKAGCNKSTFVTHLASTLCSLGMRVGHVILEEQKEFLASRARVFRIPMNFKSWFVYDRPEIEQIIEWLKVEKPQILFIDSLNSVVAPRDPGLYPIVGTLRQIHRLISKGMNITTFVVAHANKKGEIFGPNTLNHDIDAIIRMQVKEGPAGEREMFMEKNRTGPTQILMSAFVKAHEPVRFTQARKYRVKKIIRPSHRKRKVKRKKRNKVVDVAIQAPAVMPLAELNQ